MNVTRYKCAEASPVRLVLGVLFLCLLSPVIHAQQSHTGPAVAVKTNALYWATSTPNLGFEVGLGKQWTLDVLGGYNPFTFGDNKKLKHWLVQPELRWWTCERFNGHFLGVHLHGGMFNVGGVKLPFGMFPSLEDYRYEGEYYGGGLSYGYQWILGRRWSLEAEIGVGYARLNYDKYDCPKCGEYRGSDSHDFFGVTKAAISIVYNIK